MIFEVLVIFVSLIAVYLLFRICKDEKKLIIPGLILVLVYAFAFASAVIQLLGLSH